MTTTVNIHGFCDERFKPLEDAFRANFDDGLELGSSLGVTHQGKMVVDLYGVIDPRHHTIGPALTAVLDGL